MQPIPLPTEAAPLDPATRMYRRVLANWAGDLLAQSPRIVWTGDDAAADYRDRDWRKLYTGDVLDD